MFKNFELLQIGDPMLKLRAKEVDIEALQEGKQDALLKIMRMVANKNNYFELTAPQMGVLLRVVALKIDLFNESYPQDIKDNEVTLMINPKIKHIEGVSSSAEYELCTSCKGRASLVDRPDRIFLEYFTPEAIKVQIFVNGYSAHIVQHAIDHLDGKDFLVLQNEEEEIIHRHR